MEKIYELSKKGEEYNAKMMSLYYNNFAGLTAKYEISGAMKDYPELYSLNTVQFLKDIKGEMMNDEKRIAEYLLRFAVDNILEFAVSSRKEKLIEEQAAKVTKISDKNTPFRQLPILISTTPDRESRNGYYRAHSSLLEEYENDYIYIINAQHKKAKELGYRDYIDMVSDIKKIDIMDMKRRCERFLRETEADYIRLLEYFSRKYLRMYPEDMTQADMNYMLHGKWYDALFPAGKLIDTVKKTLLSMGIDMDSQRNITLDVEEREGKSSRAFVAPIRIPSDVRLVLRIRGGFEDYKTLLHESGHLEHFANTSDRLDFALKCLGDESVSEMYAFLIQYLTTSIEWCEEMMGFSDLNFLNFALFDKMYMLRRYCAKVLYEVKLHSMDEVDKRMGRVYSDILYDAVKVKYDSRRYLYDLDMGFYSIEYLIAWFGEAQLRSFFMNYFGRYWFENYHAGKVLKRLWGYGTKYRVDELLRMLSLDNVSIEPTIKDLSRIVI